MNKRVVSFTNGLQGQWAMVTGEATSVSTNTISSMGRTLYFKCNGESLGKRKKKPNKIEKPHGPLVK